MEREYSSVHVDYIKYNIRTEVYIDSILFMVEYFNFGNVLIIYNNVIIIT